MVFRWQQSRHALHLRTRPKDFFRCPQCDELIDDRRKCTDCGANVEAEYLANEKRKKENK